MQAKGYEHFPPPDRLSARPSRSTRIRINVERPAGGTATDLLHFIRFDACPFVGSAKQAASSLPFGQNVTIQTHGLDKYIGRASVCANYLSSN